MPKKTAGAMEVGNEVAEDNSSFLLHYVPEREVYFRKQRERVFFESYHETFSPSKQAPEEPQILCVSETWNNDQINDFVRKLGFLEAQSADVEQSVKLFQQMNQVSSYLHSYLAA